LIVGMLINKFIFHQSGINLIPNISFWKSIPGLIKQGFLNIKDCGKGVKRGYIDLDEPKTSEVNPFENNESELQTKSTKIEEVYQEI
jgi:hypothetical protein